MANLCPSCQFVASLDYTMSEEDGRKLIDLLATSSGSMAVRFIDPTVLKERDRVTIQLPVVTKMVKMDAPFDYGAFYGFVKGLFAYDSRIRVSFSTEYRVPTVKIVFHSTELFSTFK